MRGARRASPLAVALLVAVALTPGAAAAAEPEAITRGPQAIVGGDPVGPCEWPSVVALRTGGLCTATLVHPRVIVYAAHCGTLHTKVSFGEDVEAPAREVATLRCERNTDVFAVSSEDFAYCELAEAVDDVAITPLLFGCDEALIEIGTPVTIVGFGDTTSEGPEQTGIKHAAATQITGQLSTVGIGGMGVGADAGDSGGPALVELDDGSWWVLGIVSGGGGDGATVQYVPAPKTVAWIEERTGIDVTPCHASDGSWAPTPACEGFFVEIESGASWAAGCPGPTSPASQRCGQPWTEIADARPPIVSVVEPVDGLELPSDALEFEVVAAAEDAGVGVREVRLRVDAGPWIDAFGREAVDEVPPYAFAGVRVEGEGEHTIEVVARDHFDNVASASATLFVGEPPVEDEGDDTSETETGTAGADEDPGEPACACASERSGFSPGPGGAFALLALLTLLRAPGPRSRRRPRARSRRRR